MEIGYWIGWLGVVGGICVPIPQLIKIIKTRRLSDISLGTYSILVLVLASYLWHAIHIKSEVFATAQSINLATNGTIFIMLTKHRMKRGQLKWLNAKSLRKYATKLLKRLNKEIRNGTV